MARKEKVARVNKASKKSAVASTVGSTQYYGISGTSHIGATKEELKAKRRELNHSVGVYEVETTIEGKKIEAVSSNAWPYRITKTRAHPHNAA